MGKSAILVWPTVVVVIGIIIYLIVRQVRKMDQDPTVDTRTRKKAKLADEAYDLIREILFPRSINGEISFLSNDDKAKAKAWAEKYGKVNS